MNAMIGDNADKAERERRILFAHYHRKDRDLAAQIKALNEDKKSNRQNAKASGFPAQKLDHYLKTFLAEDQQKPVDRLVSDRQNLIWLGLIPDTNGDLLAQADRVDNEGMIRAKGFHAGLTGMDRVSGFDGGSVDDKMWLESYDAGRSEYETQIPDIIARINAEASKEAPEPDGDDPFSDEG
jgi:hypothetical protein